MAHKKIYHAILIVTAVLAAIATTKADTIRIAALGASNAQGAGVGSGQAWPDQLERMLRAKGYDVSVSVNSVSGDTSAGVLARADAAAAGARAVVFDTGAANDWRNGISASVTQGHIAQIAARIRAHGAAAIQNNYSGVPTQADGIHFTPQGHALIAARALPQVIAALGKRK